MFKYYFVFIKLCKSFKLCYNNTNCNERVMTYLIKE